MKLASSRGFNKRGSPFNRCHVDCRLIDRPIRPMFAEGFRNEVQVINTVLSYDENASAPMAAMFGEFLALSSLIFLSMVQLLGLRSLCCRRFHHQSKCSG